MLPIVRSTMNCSSEFRLARKKRSRTCLQTALMLPLAIWILYSGTNNSSSRVEGRAVMMRRSSLSDRVFCFAPVSSNTEISYCVNCKGIFSNLSFLLNRSVVVRGRTSVVGELVSRRGLFVVFAEFSLQVFCGGATSEASLVT